MNVTFLIGNGFDINCGLKCTYKDVYAGYCKTESQSEVIAKFKQEINGNIDTWADFEMAMNDYLPSFETEEDFLSCARNFKVFMVNHLTKEEKLFNSLYLHENSPYESAIKAEVSQSLESFYHGISHNISQRFRGIAGKQGSNCRFVVFNYTQSSDKILHTYIPSPQLIHIHGLLNDDPVIGIDNAQQLSNRLNFKYSNRLLREFVKPFFNEQYDINRKRIAEEWIRTSDVICVFGMSLGESDLSWRNMILNWIRNDSHHLFLYSYKYSHLSFPTVTERLDKEEEARQSFYTRMNLHEQDIAAVESKIHIPIGKNLFNIEEVIRMAKTRIAQENETKEKIRHQSTNKLA